MCTLTNLHVNMSPHSCNRLFDTVDLLNSFCFNVAQTLHFGCITKAWPVGLTWSLKTVKNFGCRAPEILLGLETYTEAIDMWSVGCIMAELLHHQPLFPAKTELGILEQMAKLLGSPNERIWPVCPPCKKKNLFETSFRHAASCHVISLPPAVLSGHSAHDLSQYYIRSAFNEMRT